jgi:hypothetical protein
VVGFIGHFAPQFSGSSLIWYPLTLAIMPCVFVTALSTGENQESKKRQTEKKRKKMFEERI